MPFDVVTADRANLLLKELVNFREKLIYELSRPEASGNLEEQRYDRFLAQLAAVQGSIAATEDYLGKS
jgi:hypothetical protein